MEPELNTLAIEGAKVLVQQMVTDGWTGIRDRVIRLFAGGSATPEAVGEELEATREELAEVRREHDEQAEQDLEAEWAGRLRRALRADPSAATGLRALLDEVTPAQQVHTVHNTMSGGTYHGTVIQAGTIGTLQSGGGN